MEINSAIWCGHSPRWQHWLPLQSAAQTNENAECGTPISGIDSWEVATQVSAGWSIEGLCALAEHLDASPQDNVHGVVVAHDNRLVFEKYLTGPDQRWGRPLGDTAHGPDVLHDVRSVTKSVVSLLVGIAIDRKLIAGVDQPVFASFPEYAAVAVCREGRHPAPPSPAR